MKRLAILVTAVLLVPASAQSRETLPTITADKPTIIAFFDGMAIATNEDSEALSDFEFYAEQAGPALQRAGIDFRVVDGSSFRIHCRQRTLTFRAGPTKVGYYLIAPGKEPHIEYGVMTDTDLIDLAGKYFGEVHHSFNVPLANSAAYGRMTSSGLLPPLMP